MKPRMSVYITLLDSDVPVTVKDTVLFIFRLGSIRPSDGSHDYPSNDKLKASTARPVSNEGRTKGMLRMKFDLGINERSAIEAFCKLPMHLCTDVCVGMYVSATGMDRPAYSTPDSPPRLCLSSSISISMLSKPVYIRFPKAEDTAEISVVSTLAAAKPTMPVDSSTGAVVDHCIASLILT